MADYSVTVGGPKDGQGLGEWSRDIHRMQREVSSKVRAQARAAVDRVYRDARAGAAGGTKIQQWAGKSIAKEFVKGAPAIRAGGRKQLNVGAGERGRDKNSRYTKAKPRTRRPILAGEIIVGAEFGGYRKNTPSKGTKPWTGSGRQFFPRTPKLGRGNEGNFLWPAIRKHYKAVFERYSKSLDDIFRK